VSVNVALYRYLTDQRALPGHPAERFAKPRVVGEVTCLTRNDARQAIRDRVGKQIYLERVPQSVGHTAIELRTITSESEYGIAGEEDHGLELLLATVHARQADAAMRANNTASLLRLAISGYSGDYWGDTYIGECLVESQSTQSTPPGDGSDDWTHSVTLDVSVRYSANDTATYPSDLLRTVIDVLQTGSQLRLSTLRSVVVPNRPLATAHWVIRNGSAAGAIVLTISGVAHSASTVPDTSGTFANPVLDTSLISLPPTYHISCTLTDDTGSTSSAEYTNA